MRDYSAFQTNNPSSEVESLKWSLKSGTVCHTQYKKKILSRLEKDQAFSMFKNKPAELMTKSIKSLICNKWYDEPADIVVHLRVFKLYEVLLHQKQQNSTL